MDRINGTRHGETLRGTQEGDIFFAKGGKDILFGEDGNDRFVFKRGDGFDRIGDFTNDSSQQDLIDLSHMNSIKNFRDLMRNHLEARDGSIFIEGGKHDVLMLAGNDMSQIEKDCFVF